MDREGESNGGVVSAFVLFNVLYSSPRGDGPHLEVLQY